MPSEVKHSFEKFHFYKKNNNFKFYITGLLKSVKSGKKTYNNVNLRCFT